MIVYSFPNDDTANGSIYCGTLKKARDTLKECLEEGDSTSITKHDTGKICKDVIVGCLNDENWCATSEEIETWASTTCESREVKSVCSGCRNDNGCDRIVIRRTK